MLVDMKKYLRLSIILPLVLASILFLAWVNRYSFVKLYYMRAYFKNSPAKLIKDHEKKILEDREILAQYELFNPSNGTRDAGPYLNPLVHWQIGDIHHQGSLTLPEFVHKEMSKDWVTKKPLFQKMGLNFTWMKELLKYDVWSPEASSPVYPAGKKYQTYSFPIPNYKDLVTWAKLRYLFGKENGDVQNALKEVRHLMRLIFTNDYLVSSMVVVNMLKMENQYEEILTPKEIGEWKFIPVDHVMRAKRYIHSLPVFVDIRLSDETFDKMIKTNTAICPMLNEGLMVYVGMRDFLGDELMYGMRRMERAVNANSCRQSILFKMWADKNWTTHTTLDGIKILNKDIDFSDVEKNSEIKAAVGYILSNVAAPAYFQYDKE
jgi:hypothetical protein